MSKTIFIVSDGTGETASIMTQAALVQYKDKDIRVVRRKNVRHSNQVEQLIEEAQKASGFIVYTVAHPDISNQIEETAKTYNVPAIDLLGGLLNKLGAYLESDTITPQAGLFRSINDHYFKRIEAMEYTVKHDDGKDLSSLDEADIVLLGVSRSSKTPLSIFLSHKGWKVANVPLVLNHPLPPELEKVDERRIIALSIDPVKLASIRTARLDKLGQPSKEYASMDYITKETEYVMSIFKQHRRWPIFDITEKALEETATEIIKVISHRLGLKSMSPLDLPYHPNK